MAAPRAGKDEFCAIQNFARQSDLAAIEMGRAEFLRNHSDSARSMYEPEILSKNDSVSIPLIWDDASVSRSDKPEDGTEEESGIPNSEEGERV
jgi:hypothetical protein